MLVSCGDSFFYFHPRAKNFARECSIICRIAIKLVHLGNQIISEVGTFRRKFCEQIFEITVIRLPCSQLIAILPVIVYPNHSVEGSHKFSISFHNKNVCSQPSQLAFHRRKWGKDVLPTFTEKRIQQGGEL